MAPLSPRQIKYTQTLKKQLQNDLKLRVANKLTESYWSMTTHHEVEFRNDHKPEKCEPQN